MRIYRLERHGRLLMTRALVDGRKGKVYPKFLLDTGSAYTILSQEILEFIGANPATTETRQRIITGSGYEIVPVVSVRQFSCFGEVVKGFSILGHTLPHGVYVDGLLGMDFLGMFDFELRINKGEIAAR